MVNQKINNLLQQLAGNSLETKDTIKILVKALSDPEKIVILKSLRTINRTVQDANIKKHHIIRGGVYGRL